MCIRDRIRANRQSRETFETSQKSYLVLGRKDGVIADIHESSDPEGWPDIVVYLQNSGHLPAHNVCISSQVSAWPVFPNAIHRDDPLRRQMGKDGQGHMQVIESACPTIGGDSTYAYVISRVFQQRVLDRIKAEPRTDFALAAAIQYCDSFGHYSCKNTILHSNKTPLVFHAISELDCTKEYGQVPTLVYGSPVSATIFGSNEPLPPCVGDDPKTQEEQLAFVKGWIRYLQERQSPRK